MVTAKTAKKGIEFKINENSCFVCTSHYVDRYGYVRCSMYGEKVRIHRLVYEECFGEIPEGMMIRHKCDNRSCINPEHLEIGTCKDNVDDMFKRKRNPSRAGEGNGRAILSPEQALEIYCDNNSTKAELATKYGVSYGCIRGIKEGRNWTHIITEESAIHE